MERQEETRKGEKTSLAAGAFLGLTYIVTLPFFGILAILLAGIRRLGRFLVEMAAQADEREYPDLHL